MKDKEVEIYRLDQVEKSLEKFVERIEGKIDRLAETFATRSALDMEVKTWNSKLEAVNGRVSVLRSEVDDVKKKKSVTTTISITASVVSAIIAILALYELFR